MNRTKKAWINGLFLLITLIINGLGAAGVINGMSQKEVSDMYNTLITPAPSTFGIWSLIYALLIISLIVMILKKDDYYYQNAIDEITVLFRISCIFNIAWIISFSYLLIELSVLWILAFAITLVLILGKLRKIQIGKRFLLPLTFGLYTGWLVIASVLNIFLVIVKLQGAGAGNEIWAIATLVIAVLLVFVIMLKSRNAVFPLPVAWGFLGIYQSLKAPDGFNGEFALLEITSLVGIVVLIGMAAIQLYKNRFSLIPEELASNRFF